MPGRRPCLTALALTASVAVYWRELNEALRPTDEFPVRLSGNETGAAKFVPPKPIP